MLIDFHTHSFPDRIAGKAMSSLAERAHIPYFTDGTVAALIAEMERNHTDYSVLLPVATTEHQTASVNSFSSECGKLDRIIAFGSVYPLAKNAVETVDGFKEAGLSGVKLHPEYQNFYADDRRVFPLYASCEEGGLPLVFHAGIDLGFSRSDVKATPRAIAEVAKAFPKLRIVAAHGGGFGLWAEAAEFLSPLENVFIDTAFLSGYISGEEFYRQVKSFGAERVLFATDSPWSTVDRERALVESLPIGSADKDLIFGKNAARLLAL